MSASVGVQELGEIRERRTSKRLDEAVWQPWVEKDIEARGGATRAPLGVRAISMSGTANRVERAERIKLQVNDIFDRLARSFR